MPDDSLKIVNNIASIVRRAALTETKTSAAVLRGRVKTHKDNSKTDPK